MSNASIIERLQAELTAYEKEERGSAEFCRTLDGAIEAMDGIPYSKIREMRHFRYELEVAGFHEEDDRFKDRTSVILRLREWLKDFKTEPNQSLQTTTMAVTDAAAQPPRQP